MSSQVVALHRNDSVSADETHLFRQLLAKGRLKDTDLARARRLHEESPDGTLTGLMARLGLVSERDLAEAWSELLDT
ncbi:MAG: hypothetical protein P4L97_16485, partial [Dyella sp.]|nr:hypothetical protein [Dyella sp.]